MAENLIYVKAFLGKYFSELNYSAIQEKYRNTNLDNFFDQRFYIQNNKTQIIIDQAMTGLIVNITGNEVHISQELYDHPGVLIANSLENQNSNPRSLYNPEVFSTLAYLVCQNHTTFQIIGELEEPIYVKYSSDFETFYNSVVTFEVSNFVDVEIVEEIASLSALNCVVNYKLHASSKVELRTFYENNISATSFVYRNVIMQEASTFNHVLFGKGSSGVIDETKVQPHHRSVCDLLGLINTNGRNFHSIMYVQPVASDYNVSVDYRSVTYGNANMSFFPVLVENEASDKAVITVTNLDLNDIPDDKQTLEVSKYIKDITDRCILERMIGVKRFHDNKVKFLNFP